MRGSSSPGPGGARRRGGGGAGRRPRRPLGLSGLRRSRHPPLSAEDGSGFENRIAELMAESLGVPVSTPGSRR